MNKKDANQRAPRVLIVAPSLDILGGQAIQAERLLTRLRAEPSLEVSFLPINPRLPGVLRKLQSIKYLRTLVTSLLYCATLLMRIPKYDVIHVFSASYFSFLLAPTPAIVIASLYNKKVILNYRSGEAEDHLEHWRRTAIPTIRVADVVVVPSGYLIDVFARLGLPARSISNFVDLDQFPFRERVPLRPVFLSNRNLEPLYNVACVLRAFAIIQEHFPEARLLVVGDGRERRDLERLARDLNLRHIEFLGQAPPEKMPALYNQADIYLNGSDIDNMPGSIVECMASGLPIVTTDAGGIPYIVKDDETCLMVQRNDHRAMASSAIRLLRDNPLADGITRRAYETSRRFTWDAVRLSWIELYYELLESKLAGKTSRPGSWQRFAENPTDSASAKPKIANR